MGASQRASRFAAAPRGGRRRAPHPGWAAAAAPREATSPSPAPERTRIDVRTASHRATPGAPRAATRAAGGGGRSGERGAALQ